VDTRNDSFILHALKLATADPAAHKRTGPMYVVANSRSNQLATAAKRTAL
jgi:hypothetical protein